MILFNFQLIEFLVGMFFIYLTFLISLTQSCIWCLAYVIGPADAYYLGNQISEHANIIFDETMRQDRLLINISLASEPMLLPTYIEDCRMKLWEHVFNTYFRGHDSFKKCDNFVGFNRTDLIVRKVFFRYVSNFEVFSINFCNYFNWYYVSC